MVNTDLTGEADPVTGKLTAENIVQEASARKIGKNLAICNVPQWIFTYNI